MNDNACESGGDLELDEGSGGEDQGHHREAGEANPGPGDGQDFSQWDPGGAPSQSEDQDGDNDLYFRLQVLKALGAEADPQVRIQYLKLLDTEGQRKAEIAQQELANGLEEARSDATAVKSSNTATLWAAIFDTLQKFGNWVAATAFAFFLAWWWIQFLRNGKEVPAAHIKDILMVMLGGALGWIGKGWTSKSNG